MWLGSLFSAVIGNLLPGPGTLYRGQNLTFFNRAHVGETLTVRVTVAEKNPPNTVVLNTQVLRGDEVMVEGVATVVAPKVHATIAASALPELMVVRHRHLERLMLACRDLQPMTTAVVAPEEANALSGALAGMRAGLITPILVGDAAKISNVAAKRGLSLHGVAILNIQGHDAAAARAVELVHEGEAAAIMKGHLHTDELLRHVVKSQGGLRGTRRISHVFVMDAPTLNDLLLVSDAAINIAPTLKDKVHITQNAIDLALALGIIEPKVGILSAVETVNPDMPSTLDAAALSKMAERGQIRGGIVDGPLAMDNAINLTAAKTKGLTSPVAGQRRRAGRAEPRGRQHPGQAADLRRPGRGRRARARRAGADPADQPRRRGDGAPVLLRGGGALRPLAEDRRERGAADAAERRRPHERDHVVTLNAGSSSIKFALFELDDDGPRVLGVGAGGNGRARPGTSACAMAPAR